MQISVPSKTFLIGEYVAMHGGPALLLGTDPRFELRITRKSGGSKNISAPFQELLKKPIYRDFDFEFYDPHLGRGGFGASGALATMLMSFPKLLNHQEINHFELCTEVQDFWGENMGSGYDVISQLSGQISFICKNEKLVKRISWPFENLEIILLRGPHKTNTHEFLSEKKRWQDLPIEQLSKKSQWAFEALRMEDSDLLVTAINDFHNELLSLHLCDTQSAEWVEELKMDPVVKAAKGCGAMGSDVLLLIVTKDRPNSWDENLRAKFERVDAPFSNGIQVKDL